MSEKPTHGRSVHGWTSHNAPSVIWLNYADEWVGIKGPIRAEGVTYKGWTEIERPLEPDAPEPASLLPTAERVRTMLSAAAAFAVEQGTKMKAFQAMAGAAHAVATKRAQKAKGEQS